MKESDLYEPVAADLRAMASKLGQAHIEITANRRFTNKLMAEVPSYRSIVFAYLKKAAPDITGFVKREYSVDWIVVEVKNSELKLDDVGQVRIYADLFQAKFAVLVSTQEIPTEMIRLHQATFSLLSLQYGNLAIARFDRESCKMVDWYPRCPFEEPR